MDKRYERLEGLANMAIVIAAVVNIVVWTRAYVARSSTVADGSAYHLPGEVLPTNAGIDFSRTPTSLVVVVSSSCRFCTESMPFYRRLTAPRTEGQAAVRIVMVGQEHIERLRDYLSEHQVTPDAVVSVGNESSMKVRRTPVILHVDSKGQVIRTWNGRLSSAAEQAVLAVAMGSDEMRPGS